MNRFIPIAWQLPVFLLLAGCGSQEESEAVALDTPSVEAALGEIRPERSTIISGCSRMILLRGEPQEPVVSAELPSMWKNLSVPLVWIQRVLMGRINSLSRFVRVL